jgi:heme-degrading monooxygenase HmoA
MANRMVELAEQQPGFLGMASVREEVGITVSCWRGLDSIKQWKANTEHQQAQRQGKEHWYSAFNVRIVKVEQEYNFDTLT